MLHLTTFQTICAVLTAIVVVCAMITDLRSRRIPNVLTFTAVGVALVVHLVLESWVGLGIAFAGAVIAPVVLLLVHMGKGLGMGDLKLAAAVGAFLGPTLAVASMLCGAVLGGLLAIALLMRRGQPLSEFFAVLLIGLPFLKGRKTTAAPATPAAAITMPYGVAIGMGSLVTLAVYAWLGTL